jgi:hypothetical protein
VCCKDKKKKRIERKNAKKLPSPTWEGSNGGLSADKAGLLPNKAGLLPNKAGLLPNKAGLLPNKAGLLPNKAGLLPNKAGLFRTVQFAGLVTCEFLRFKLVSIFFVVVHHVCLFLVVFCGEFSFVVGATIYMWIQQQTKIFPRSEGQSCLVGGMNHTVDFQ